MPASHAFLFHWNISCVSGGGIGVDEVGSFALQTSGLFNNARLQRKEEEKKLGLTSELQQIQYAVGVDIFFVWLMVWILVVWNVLR
jgi:hypothetical protein